MTDQNMKSYIVRFNAGPCKSIMAQGEQGIKDFMVTNNLTIKNIEDIVEYTKMYFTEHQFKELLGVH